MEPVQDAAAAGGLAILVARHARKSGGDVGDSGRGSSQASGDVDIVLDLKRPEGNTPTNRRILRGLSRYGEDTPEEIVIELTDEGYTLLGNRTDVSAADALRAVRALLETGAQEDGWTHREITEQSDTPSTNVTRAIRELQRLQEVTTTGRGTSNSPKRHKMVAS